MPAAFTLTFAERLHKQSRLEVAEAQDQGPFRPGRALVAPWGMQTPVAGRPGALWVWVRESRDQWYKPSVKVPFASAARVMAESALAIVLIGVGADGKKGAQKLKQQGGRVWSQDAERCVVYGMRQAVGRAGRSDRVLSRDALAPALAEIESVGPT